jgi:hypothetical protein
MAIGGLNLVAATLLSSAGLLSASFIGTRALLARPEPEVAPALGADGLDAVASQRQVQLPFASRLDVAALNDGTLFKARGALVRALKEQAFGFAGCLQHDDGAVQGHVSLTYDVAVRDGALQAILADAVKYRPVATSNPGGAADALTACVAAKVQRQVVVRPPGGKLAYEGDLGEKTFDLQVGGKIRACGL